MGHAIGNNNMKDRIVSIMILRVAAMLMVVMFHCLCFNAGIWKLGEVYSDKMFMAVAVSLNSIDMPIFFLIIRGALF